MLSSRVVFVAWSPLAGCSPTKPGPIGTATDGAQEGRDTIHLRARFVYGPDKDQTVGWYYLTGPEPHPDRQVETQSSEVASVKCIVPVFTEAMRQTGLTSVACDARFPSMIGAC